MGHPRGTHSRYVIGCCLIPLEICGVKNNSRRITYGIGCIWGMPSLSPLSSLGYIQLNKEHLPGFRVVYVIAQTESECFGYSYEKIEAKITFFFCSRIINLSFNGLAYNKREHFAHC